MPPFWQSRTFIFSSLWQFTVLSDPWRLLLLSPRHIAIAASIKNNSFVILIATKQMTAVRVTPYPRSGSLSGPRLPHACAIILNSSVGVFRLKHHHWASGQLSAAISILSFYFLPPIYSDQSNLSGPLLFTQTRGMIHFRLGILWNDWVEASVPMSAETIWNAPVHSRKGSDPNLGSGRHFIRDAGSVGAMWIISSYHYLWKSDLAYSVTYISPLPAIYSILIHRHP